LHNRHGEHRGKNGRDFIYWDAAAACSRNRAQNSTRAMLPHKVDSCQGNFVSNWKQGGCRNESEVITNGIRERKDPDVKLTSGTPGEEQYLKQMSRTINFGRRNKN